MSDNAFGIVLVRHGERLDRAVESKGGDWISSADRPQDPPLSAFGEEQAIEVGKQLKHRFGANISCILCSPMIRTVRTAELIALEVFGTRGPLYVENGLVEAAKCMRGRDNGEPRPNFNPLYYSSGELKVSFPGVSDHYTSLISVDHVKDDSVSNTVREVHPTLTNPHEISRSRFKSFTNALLSSQHMKGVVVCVGHGASLEGIADALQVGLEPHMCIQGTRHVSSWGFLKPIEGADAAGLPWHAPSGLWEPGGGMLTESEAAEAVADLG